MVLENLTWNEIIKSEKKIIFFGAGQLLAGNLLIHDDWHLYTEYIVDNNSEKWDTWYEFKGISKEIKSPLILEKIDSSKYIIVISVGMILINEIYEQLEAIENLRNVECCVLKFMNVRDGEIKEQLRNYPSSFRMSDKAKIPKCIHYCWFGKNPIPEKNKIWMESWKKYCPDYEIIEWNEDNYDVNKNKFMKQAYTDKKWGFVPDYARLDIIYSYGGIYLDTDVELLKPLDDLLYQEAFCGIDDSKCISLGLGFGAEKNNRMIGELRGLYDDLEFNVNKMVAAPTMQKQYFKNKGYKMNGDYQIIDNVVIYPEKVLSGKSNVTGAIKPTEHTYAIHHYDGSWVDSKNMISIRKSRELYARINKMG